MSLTKDKITNRLHTNLGLNRKESLQLLESLLNIMQDNLTQREGFLVSGLGKFSVRQKKGYPHLTAQKGIGLQGLWNITPTAEQRIAPFPEEYSSTLILFSHPPLLCNPQAFQYVLLAQTVV